MSLTPQNEAEVEEAYGVLTALPYGLVPKFGRFFSGIGYLNEQHQHVWDFQDAPLVYQAFLDNQFAQDGAQLKWVAPTDMFLELGAEIGNGDAFPGSPRDSNGIGAASVFVHAGGDIGDNASWRAGLSYLGTRASDREGTLPDTAGSSGERRVRRPQQHHDCRFHLEVRAHRQREAHQRQGAGRVFLAARARRPHLRR